MVGAAGIGESISFSTPSGARLPLHVADVSSFEEAIDFLDNAPANRQDPELVIVAPPKVDDNLDGFLSVALEKLNRRPSPLVLLVPEVPDGQLSNWYTAGINSVIESAQTDLATAIQSICNYWLVHNRTPKRE